MNLKWFSFLLHLAIKKIPHIRLPHSSDTSIIIVLIAEHSIIINLCIKSLKIINELISIITIL
jgi:hypothetical protein